MAFVHPSAFPPSNTYSQPFAGRFLTSAQPENIAPTATPVCFTTIATLDTDALLHMAIACDLVLT